MKNFANYRVVLEAAIELMADDQTAAVSRRLENHFDLPVWDGCLPMTQVLRNERDYVRRAMGARELTIDNARISIAQARDAGMRTVFTSLRDQRSEMSKDWTPRAVQSMKRVVHALAFYTALSPTAGRDKRFVDFMREAAWLISAPEQVRALALYGDEWMEKHDLVGVGSAGQLVLGFNADRESLLEMDSKALAAVDDDSLEWLVHPLAEDDGLKIA